jgi:DegV family protein with EDD domain
MKKVAIIVDSVAAIPPEVAGKYGITVLPFHIAMEGKDYLDTTIDKEQLYSRIMSKNLPTVSPPSPGKMSEAFRQVSQRAKAILYITMTSGFSGEYERVKGVKSSAEKELPGIAIEAIDSLTVTCAQAFIAIEAARAASQGKSFPEVVEIARQMVKQVTSLTVRDSLYFFDKSGRLGKERPLAGSPIPLAPILEIDASTGGVTQAVSKHRTVAKAVENMLAMMKKKSANKKLHAILGHAYKPDTAEELKKKVLSEFQPAEFYVTEVDPVAAIINGPYIDLGFFTED